jgi:hypothetical protein
MLALCLSGCNCLASSKNHEISVKYNNNFSGFHVHGNPQVALSLNTKGIRYNVKSVRELEDRKHADPDSFFLSQDLKDYVFFLDFSPTPGLDDEDIKTPSIIVKARCLPGPDIYMILEATGRRDGSLINGPLVCPKGSGMSIIVEKPRACFEYVADLTETIDDEVIQLKKAIAISPRSASSSISSLMSHSPKHLTFTSLSSGSVTAFNP